MRDVVLFKNFVQTVKEFVHIQPGRLDLCDGFVESDAVYYICRDRVAFFVLAIVLALEIALLDQLVSYIHH